MSARLCLVDGTYELFRAFYGAPSRPTSEGRELGAVGALGRSLLALARRGGFGHFAVAFDTVIESFRNELFPGYKTGEGIDPALWSQFEPAERLIEALGFVVLSMREFEADDGLATLAARFESHDEVEEIVIASPDKDLMQCVRGTRVVTWDRLRDVRYDEAGVMAKMGVPPASIPDYLALVGDTADGIPGVTGWGARGTAALLAHYRHLEDLPRDAALWVPRVRGAANMARELEAAGQDVYLYRTLATLRRDVPLPHQLGDLAWTGARAEAVRELAARWGEPRLLELVSDPPVVGSPR